MASSKFPVRAAFALKEGKETIFFVRSWGCYNSYGYNKANKEAKFVCF
jgi:hypothetical protein